MKPILTGEVYEVLTAQNGILFSYCKERIDDKVVVAYKMLSFDGGSYTDVAKNVYLLTKFGTNFKAVAMLCDNYITVKSIVLPGNKIFLLQSDGTAQLLDVDTTPIWSGELTYRTCPPSDIVLYKNALWACYKEVGVLLRFNLSTMREELRIGGGNSPFKKPRNLFVEGDNIIVSNSGANKLTEVNLNSYTLIDTEEFSESVYQYVRMGEYRFAVLASGLYLL